ncbi:NtaA/DmoA family FMN-dependent monooxygenase [Arthrobacter sp. MYb213]|uniref:NtaA/DmoA family FMN-dependent monooxygenase n=1 Tax=Arthrobacter sp. MYb213 TaxID=1848595 RepID=UPI000CFA9494|nr:NtaA/DmoA family FMN-dependent monooxygenase [Arthrobacter sp. MYb213]PRB69320.1 LLM class flavin-dependent oxidoreductase [Arthrobacter sp. MYb213]
MGTFDSRPRFILSAFLMNTSSHILGGMWRHPDAQQDRFHELGLWVDLAKKLEEAKFDNLFFADVAGVYGDHEGGWASLARKGMQIPSHDPMVLLSALSATTKDIGLAMTSSVVQSHPFQFARQISTLDHLSQGRVAWNIVTSVLENTHRNFGAKNLMGHDDRYGWAEEYVDAAYKLWEGSWEDDALKADKESGLYADPARINKINHRGEIYSIDGPHQALPSAQRTPFLFQAGSSARGSQFAATHAEATFLFAPHPQYVAKKVTGLTQNLQAAGRTREDIKVFAGLSFVVGSTEAEAKALEAEYDQYLDPHAIIAHIGGGIGVDLGGLELDTPLGEVKTEGAQGVLEAVLASTPGRNPTLRDLAHYRAKAQQIVGTPEQITDKLLEWQDAGIDGLNVMNHILPGSYDNFIEGLLPELQRRGLAQTEYAPGSLREKVFGRGDKLPENHPAAKYRGSFGDLSATNLEKDLQQVP